MPPVSAATPQRRCAPSSFLLRQRCGSGLVANRQTLAGPMRRFGRRCGSVADPVETRRGLPRLVFRGTLRRCGNFPGTGEGGEGRGVAGEREAGRQAHHAMNGRRLTLLPVRPGRLTGTISGSHFRPVWVICGLLNSLSATSVACHISDVRIDITSSRNSAQTTI
jgi:hypothetical protein